MTNGYITINPTEIVYETVDHEVVIINMTTGNYYSLVQSGVAVWERLQDGASRDELVAHLEQQYDATSEEIAVAVDQLIDELLLEDIVVLESSHEVDDAGREPSAAVSMANGERRFFQAPTLSKYTNMSDLLLLDPIHDVDDQGWPHQPSA